MQNLQIVNSLFTFLLENSWINKLKLIFDHQQTIEESSGDEQISHKEIKNKQKINDNSINSIDKNKQHDDDLDSSLDLDYQENDNENNRMIYMKVVNAFLEQDSIDGHDEYFLSERNENKDAKLQKSIQQQYYKEFETDFQLNKLYVDNNPVLDIVEMNVFDRIALFQAHTLLEKAYKEIWYAKEVISQMAYNTVNHSVFTFISLVVIAFNSLMLAQDDPTTNTDNNADVDLALLIIYSIEMILKILAYGFIFGKNAYIQDAWNIVDLVIIVTGYLPYVLNSNSVNLSALRSLRVLRPLRSVSKVKSLNQLLTALFSAIPLLKDVLIILGFFFAIFGIAGLQLFTGQLKTRCYDSYTGIYMGDEKSNLFICASDSDCPVVDNINYICAKGMVSPNYDFYNFDTFGWSILNVYIIVSNEGWSQIMYYIQVGFSVSLHHFILIWKFEIFLNFQFINVTIFLYYTVFYFLFTIYIGTFFLMNLTMAIIGVKYSEALKNQSEQSTKKVNQDGYSMQNLIKWGIYKSNKILYKEIDEYKKSKRKFFNFSFRMNSLIGSFKNSPKQVSIKQDEIQETIRSKSSKVHPLMGGSDTNGEELSPKLSLDQSPILNVKNISSDQIIENEVKLPTLISDSNVQPNNRQSNDYEQRFKQISNSNNEMIMLLNEINNDNSKEQVKQDTTNKLIPQQITISQTIGIMNGQISPKKRFSSPLKSDRSRKRDSQNIDKVNLESIAEGKNENIIQDSENNLLMDPNILKNKLEIINNNPKGNKKNRRTTYLKQIGESQERNQPRKKTQNLFFVGDKKINFAPISNQIRKNSDQTKKDQENENLFTERKKNQKKTITEMRRTSKRLFNFQFFDSNNNNEEDKDEFCKLDDEDFLFMIEQKEMKKDQMNGGISDNFIESQHLNSIGNNFTYTKVRNKSIQNFPLSPVCHSETNSLISSRSNFIQDKQQINNNQNDIQNSRRSSFKKFMFQTNKYKNKSNTSNKIYQTTPKNTQNTFEYRNFSIGEESESDVSQISFINSPQNKHSIGNGKPLSRKGTFQNLFKEMDIKFGQTNVIKQQQSFKQKIEPIINKKFERDPTIFKNDESDNKDMDDSELKLDYANKIENQIVQKINKQIDSKADDFKLLLDQKYLKPRVLYEQPSDYTDDVQPHKKQKIIEEIKEKQANKLKTMKFIIKQSSSVVISKKRQKYLGIQLNVPYRKSVRSIMIAEEKIFKDMLEGKIQKVFHENQSQKLSKREESERNDISNIGSPHGLLNKNYTQNKIYNKNKTTTEEDKNILMNTSQFKSGCFSPKYFEKSQMIIKQNNQELCNEDGKEDEIIQKENDKQPQVICDTENNQLNKENINGSMQDIIQQVPPMLKRNSSEVDNRGLFLFNNGERNSIDIQQLENLNIQKNISYNSQHSSQIIQQKRHSSKLIPTLSYQKSTMVSFSGKEDQDKQLLNKGTVFRYDRKSQVGLVNNGKKGKVIRGDELENAWNFQKAMNKIFSEDLNDNDGKIILNSNNKNYQENMMQQIEQKIIKKSEVQLDLLNRQKSINNQDAATQDNLSLNNIEETDLTQKNDEVQEEVFDAKAFEIQPVDHQFLKIRKKEITRLEKKRDNQIKVTTSADDVLKLALKLKSQNAINLMINSLNHPLNITEQNEGGFNGLFQAFRRRIKYLVLHSTFDNMIMMCVVMNTVILCLDGLVVNEDSLNTLSKFNYSFTIIFAIDMFLKIVGQGFVEYASDKMNIFDSIIVTLSIFELVFLGGSGSSISAFRSIRILRVFRVLRMTRLLRSLQFMKLMITAIASTLEQFIYILLLLFLFMFIYSLLGMSVFGGNFPVYNQQLPSRLNFDSFLNSAFAVLDVLTLENWNDLLTTCLLAQSINNSICSLYLISWIFIGNYVFMNLVLAVIMDSFDSAEVQRDKQEIENRFEVLPDLDLNHASMGTTFMNNLSVGSGSLSQGGGGGKQSGLLKSNTISNKSFNRSKTNKDSNEVLALEKSKTIVVTEGDEDDSDDDTSMNVMKSKKSKSNKKGNKEVLYENVYCEKSLYIFSKESEFRKTIYKIYKHQMFEKVILIAIIFTSFKLTVDTYISSTDVEATIISEDIDVFFTIFFICEALLKIIALGYIQDEGSYLRDSWSQLDFFIVCSSIIDMSLSSVNLSAIKILRLLRTLRPLRLLSQNKSMKLIVTALLESVGGIANMIVVVILIWLMFAILGMNLMKGKLNYCDFGDNSQNYDIYSYNQEQCKQIASASWKTYDVNSDNIGTSMLMLFILSTFEGWPNYVWNYLDGDDSGPVKNNSTYFAGFFFVFIFIGSFFSINLFTAIIAFNFDIASKKSKNQYLTDEQSQWIELQKLIINSTPDFTSMKPPENKFRKLLWRIVQSPFLETFIIICIIGNIITMAMAYDTSTSEYDNILANINLAFTIVFILESIFKIIAFGVQGFFYKGWNQFDFFVVCTSIVDITMTYSGNQVLSFLRVGPQIARVLRVLRVSRLLKLIKSFQGLQKLVQTTIFAFPKLLNATALFMLFYFLFANLACFLFSNITDGKRINNFNNFSTFHRSFLMLFRCSTGEDWYIVMFDAAKYQGMISIAFFISFYTVQSYILMNLFVLIIMNEFEENYINPDNPLQNFNEQEENFKSQWVLMTQKENGIKIHERFLTDFYFDLPKPLGFDYEKLKKEFVENLKAHDREIKQEYINSRLDKFKIRQKQEAEKKIMKMNIFCDFDGFVYFNELLFYFFKFSLYEAVYEFDETSQSESNIQKYNTAMDILRKEERVCLKKIAIIKKKQSNLLKSKIVQQRQQGVNPMVRRLFVGMAFRSWIQYSIRTQDNINQINFNRDDISSESDSDYSNDELENENSKNFLDKSIDNQFEKSQTIGNGKPSSNHIEFKKSNRIIKREHTVAFRKNGLAQYREQHQNQQQNYKQKRYSNLPNTDIYKNEFYNEEQNKYYNSQIFDCITESKNEINNESFINNVQNTQTKSTNNQFPIKQIKQNIKNKLEENSVKEASLSQSSSDLSSNQDVEKQSKDDTGKLKKQKSQQQQIPKLLLENLNNNQV